MRVRIQDRDALLAVTPAETTGYLRAGGWSLAHTDPGRVALYRQPAPEPGGEPFEVEVPLSAELRDYAQRIADLLYNLEIVERRSQLDILRDLQRATVDTIRIAVDAATTSADGRIGLDAGSRIFADVRDLMLAAACAAIEPRAVYAARKPERAMAYLRQIRLGPTEAGSFVVTVESPVAPRLLAPNATDDAPPFERVVTATLAEAAEETRRAAADAAASGTMDPFIEGIAKGVNANLCEAIAGLLACSDGRRLSLQFQWSPARPAPAGVPGRVQFGADVVPMLQEVSRMLRERAPRAGFELVGPVRKLESPDPSVGGAVSIAGMVDGGVRPVRVELSAEDYRVAALAHTERTLVRCEGELVRDGRSWVLRTPRFLAMVEER
jgi:hypothetical protein